MSEPGATSEDPTDLEAWRTATELAVPFDEALDGWAQAAHAVLAEIAGRYGAFVSFAELAARAQAETGITTKSPVRTWILPLLHRVTEQCNTAGEPPLVALAVGHDQKVGEGCAHAVAAADLPVPADLDEHAAAARFACYLHFGATIPAGAGPQLTPKLEEARIAAQAKVTRARPKKSSGRVVKARVSAMPVPAKAPSAAKAGVPAKPEPRQAKLCPDCNTEVAATGVCGYC